MFVRRTAALRLVQMAAGGSLGEAAGFLGTATTRTAWQGRIYSGAGHVHTGASRQPDPQGFETALSGLAREPYRGSSISHRRARRLASPAGGFPGPCGTRQVRLSSRRRRGQRRPGIHRGRILGGSPDDVRELLRQLLPSSTRKASRTYWGLRVLRSATPCSEGLQTAYAPLLRTFTREGSQPQGRRNAVLRPERWGPENIPAFLPRDWCDRHLTPIAGVNRMFVRRTAALRLVQMVAGGSLGEAAGFLGIASTDTTWLGKSGIYSGVGRVHTGARQQPDPLGFEAALAAIARELDDPATPLVNYQRRRQALKNWCIGRDTWTSLTARLPPVSGPRPEIGDRKRQIASMYAWVQVTSGEHHFAPRPIEAAQPPEIQDEWKNRRNTIWSLMNRSRPGPHYSSLKAELDVLAASLERTVDAAAQPQDRAADQAPT